MRSLVDQLSDVEPAASLPLIVSAMAAALDQETLCVHLLDTSVDPPVLRRSAAVGLPAPMLSVNDELSIGAAGGCAGLAAASGEVAVVDDLAVQPLPEPYRRAAAASGVQSEWAAPVVGARGVLGTVSGYGRAVGRPDAERLELARLYLGYAAAAIERERLLAEVSRRNRVLEAVRGMLETLAGPERVEGGFVDEWLRVERVQRGLHFGGHYGHLPPEAPTRRDELAHSDAAEQRSARETRHDEELPPVETQRRVEESNRGGGVTLVAEHALHGCFPPGLARRQARGEEPDHERLVPGRRRGQSGRVVLGEEPAREQHVRLRVRHAR